MISDDVMIVVWAAFILFVIFASYRTKIAGILFLSVGGVAWLLFYWYTHFGLWDTYDAAVSWSRTAHIVNVLSTSIALYLMLLSARWKE